MKNLSLLFLFSLIAIGIRAQDELPEKKVKTEMEAVRVYTEKAEITRSATVSIPQGKSKLVFTGLSPEIDGGSIRLDGKGFTILSVNALAEIPEGAELEAQRKPLIEQLEGIEQEISEMEAQRDDLKQARKILLANQSIKGNGNLAVAELRSAMQFFQEQLQQNTEAQIQQTRLIAEKEEEADRLIASIKALGLKEVKKLGRVVATVEAKQAISPKLTISYIVSNARWLPSYDVRFSSVGEPLAINYKANIQQSTGIDWKGVALTVSSGNPSKGGQSPKLTPWQLDYWTIYQPATSASITEVSGVVYDAADQSPLPGVSVIIDGTTIGTSTDIDGRYNLSLPSSAEQLRFSYIGYKTQTRNIDSESMNVALPVDNMALEEVVVAGYSRRQSKRKEAETRASRVLRASQKNQNYSMSAQQQQSNALEVQPQEYQTNFAYDIETPYTIPSNNRSYAVEMVRHEVPASYRYSVTPKLLEKAFLTAQILNWGKYNLLEGEANLFFENSFVGKTVLELKQASDTLNLSIGRDERIIVKREKEEAFIEKKLIGTKRKETQGWKITLRNTKSEAVEIMVVDHIPVSVNEEIKVELENRGGAEYNEQTGFLSWRLTLKANESRELNYKYSVSYPRGGEVFLD